MLPRIWLTATHLGLAMQPLTVARCLRESVELTGDREMETWAWPLVGRLSNTIGSD